MRRFFGDCPATADERMSVSSWVQMLQRSERRRVLGYFFEVKKHREKRKDLGRKKSVKNHELFHMKTKRWLEDAKDDSVEGDARAGIEKTIEMSGMKGVEYTIKCPPIPITHAFVEFRESDERDRYVRSANMLRAQLNGRMIKISPAMDVDERFHQKKSDSSNMLYTIITSCLYTKIKLNHKKRVLLWMDKFWSERVKTVN